MAIFWIQRLNTFTNEYEDNYGPVDDSKRIQSLLREFRRSSPTEKFRVRRIEDDDAAWHKREDDRFASGHYVPVPDLNYANPKIAYEFPHLSNKFPGKIAFTPDNEAGRADRKVAMKAGRYLAQRFPSMSPTIVAQISAKVNLLTLEAKVEFATTPDEIESVYLNGPNSCMSHDLSYYASKVHPVRVYGAGDLAVAYINRETKGAAARALCWPDKKKFSRVYGDGGAFSAKLKSTLLEAGYEEDWRFHGARLLRIVHEKGSSPERDVVVIPYVDGDNKVFDYGDVLVMNDDRYKGREPLRYVTSTFTCGISDGREPENETWECHSCGDEYNGDDESYECQGEIICSTCNENASNCDVCSERYYDNNMTFVHSTDELVCVDCLSEHFARCDDCKEWFREKELEDGVCGICERERLKKKKEQEVNEKPDEDQFEIRWD